jgi:small subunit ribosomal protein S1
VKILEIDSERRRLSLSIKRVEGQVLPVRPIVPPAEGDSTDLDDVPELGLSEDVFAASDEPIASSDEAVAPTDDEPAAPTDEEPAASSDEPAASSDDAEAPDPEPAPADASQAPELDVQDGVADAGDDAQTGATVDAEPEPSEDAPA